MSSHDGRVCVSTAGEDELEELADRVDRTALRLDRLPFKLDSKQRTCAEQKRSTVSLTISKTSSSC